MARIHFIAMSGAGREANNVPFFTEMTDLRDYLYASAKTAYEREYNCLFEDGYEFDPTNDDAKWRAAVNWAVDMGREEWLLISREPNFVKDGHAYEGKLDVVCLDNEYLEKLDTDNAPAPGA